MESGEGRGRDLGEGHYVTDKDELHSPLECLGNGWIQDSVLSKTHSSKGIIYSNA